MAGCRQAGSVVAERDPNDRGGVPVHGVLFLPTFDVPKPHGPVTTGSGNQRTIGAEIHSVHCTVVVGELTELRGRPSKNPIV
jgi:hypothetical protein